MINTLRNILIFSAVGLAVNHLYNHRVVEKVSYTPPEKSVPMAIIQEFDPEPVAPKVECIGCTENEKKAAQFFYDRGVTDKMALATVMGNIKQESNFHSNICEGGARVSYEECRRGGYGLIQFTSTNRFNGLKTFAEKYGGDPSSFDTQLRYIVNEKQWQDLLPYLQEQGRNIDYYMHKAWNWLGWGVKGSRTYHAEQYAKKLVLP